MDPSDTKIVDDAIESALIGNQTDMEKKASEVITRLEELIVNPDSQVIDKWSNFRGNSHLLLLAKCILQELLQIISVK